MGTLLKRHRWIAPVALLTPGILWLLVFYLYPAVQMFHSSLWSGSLEKGFEFSFSNYTNYTEGLAEYAPIYLRSIMYAGAATVLTALFAYPLAYTIAFKGGRYKNLLLFLVVAPFFTSFLLRTISWKILLGDSSPILQVIHLFPFVPEDFRLLATPIAVISGITYGFLPFMTLPVYVALEKVDIRLVEAARDLYAGPWRPGGAIAGFIVGGGLATVLGLAFGWEWLITGIVGAIVGAAIGWLFISESFIRVTLPLSLPGVFAGSLLTFIPAIGDYVNAEMLGNPDTTMIGNVIQNKFLTQNDYPAAAALSFMLMAGVLVVIAIYARILGTEELSASAEALMAVATGAPAATGSQPSVKQVATRFVDRWLLVIYAILAVIYLLTPVAIIILFSFNDPAGRSNFTWQGFTLKYWLNPFGVNGLPEAVGLSLVIAFLSTLIATALGTLVAIALERYRFRGRSAINSLIFLPMATPEIIMGASLLTLFVSIGAPPFFPLNFTTILIAHIMFNISFVVVTVRARLAGFPRHLEEAAADLYANEWQTFWRVTFPLILPGVVAAALLAFSLSIDDFVITNFSAGKTQTFPMYIYAKYRIGIPVQVNVIGTVIFLVAVGAVLLTTISGRRRR